MFNRKKIKQLNETIADLNKRNEELMAKNQQLSEELNYANNKSDFYEKTSDNRLDKILDEQKAYNSSIYNNLNDVGELEDLLSSVCKSIDILSTVNPKVRLNAVHDVYKILDDALKEYQNNHKIHSKEEIDVNKEINPFNPTEEKAIIKENDVDDTMEV